MDLPPLGLDPFLEHTIQPLENLSHAFELLLLFAGGILLGRSRYYLQLARHPWSRCACRIQWITGWLLQIPKRQHLRARICTPKGRRLSKLSTPKTRHLELLRWGQHFCQGVQEPTLEVEQELRIDTWVPPGRVSLRVREVGPAVGTVKRPIPTVQVSLEPFPDLHFLLLKEALRGAGQVTAPALENSP